MPLTTLSFRRYLLLSALLLLSGFLLAVHATTPSSADSLVVERLLEQGLRSGEAYAMLSELTSKAGHRLSGSPGAVAAVRMTQQMMADKGFDKVHLEPVMVPHWVRGSVETAVIEGKMLQAPLHLNVCALGGSIATPPEGITGQVVEVKSFEELEKLGSRARGKIIFFNRPMDLLKLNTFEAYGGAVNQRTRGAVEAARAGGIAAIVRSMTMATDDVPHTGAMNYVDTVGRVPAAAVSIIGAEQLSRELTRDPNLKLTLTLACESLPDVESYNVVGELTGSIYPNEVIVIGGHLDSWDKGTGAHDDGAGSIQAIEALRLLKVLDIKPKRTIRAVLFMNEENGTRGAKAYPVAPERNGERPFAAIESDRGGFSPRGIYVDGDSALLASATRWQPLFERMLAGRIVRGGSGSDVGPLVATGVPGFGLLVDTNRYFDYHHSDNDTIDKVNPRELELGAVVEALLAYLISERGL